jgi:hypothetical protein
LVGLSPKRRRRGEPELSNRAPSVKTFLAKPTSALTAAMAQCGLAAAER